MLKSRLPLAAVPLLAVSCVHPHTTVATSSAPDANVVVSTLNPDNPFAKPSPLLYQAPQFDKIHDSDYQPAIEEGIRQNLAEVNTIANQSAPATFDNTIVAM